MKGVPVPFGALGLPVLCSPRFVLSPLGPSPLPSPPSPPSPLRLSPYSLLFLIIFLSSFHFSSLSYPPSISLPYLILLPLLLFRILSSFHFFFFFYPSSTSSFPSPFLLALFFSFSYPYFILPPPLSSFPSLILPPLPSSPSFCRIFRKLSP